MWLVHYSHFFWLFYVSIKIFLLQCAKNGKSSANIKSMGGFMKYLPHTKLYFKLSMAIQNQMNVITVDFTHFSKLHSFRIFWSTVSSRTKLTTYFFLLLEIPS